jgi:hypothetical protein
VNKIVVVSEHNREYGKELFAIVFTVFAFSTSGIVSQQDGTHFALTWSIARGHHSFSLSNDASSSYSSGYVTTKITGQDTYSMLPPGLSFFGLAFVAPGQAVQSYSAIVGEYLAPIFSSLAGGFAVFFFYYKLLRFFSITRRSSSFIALVFAFGTGMWVYSRLYLPEALATLLGIAAVYFTLLATRAMTTATTPLKLNGELEYRRGIIMFSTVSGILLALMFTVDNMAIFFGAVLISYLLVTAAFRNKDGRFSFAVLPLFITGLVLGFVPFMYYNFYTTGNILSPPYGFSSILLGGVSSQAYGSNLCQFFIGLFRNIPSPQSGLFFFTPFVLISIVSFRSLLLCQHRQVDDFLKKGFLLLFLGLFLSILIPFSLQTSTTYLHNAVGPSEIILGVPYLLIPAGKMLDWAWRGRRNDKKSLFMTVGSFGLGATSIFHKRNFCFDTAAGLFTT